MKDMKHENQKEGLKPGKLLHLNTMLHVNWSCVTTSYITLTAYKCTQNRTETKWVSVEHLLFNICVILYLFFHSLLSEAGNR